MLERRHGPASGSWWASGLPGGGEDEVFGLVGDASDLFEGRQRIRERLKDWKPEPVAAAVFGSAARGDGGPGSDSDLFIVRSYDVDESNPTWASLFDDLAHRVLRWSGNHASVIQANRAQVTNMARRGGPVVDALRADAVPLTETTVLPAAQRTRR